MFRYGKVFNYNQKKNTVDCFLTGTGGAYYDVPIVSMTAGTNTGWFEFPDLKTIKDTRKKFLSFDSNLPSGSVTTPVKNLYAFENIDPNSQDLEDPTTSYVYAVLGMIDEKLGKNNPVCLGFLFPQNNQVLFDPENLPKNLNAVQQEAVKRMAGAFLHRYNSDVYEVVDANGNMEWSHPNGTFFRIAETPTQAIDGVVHVDFTGANAMAEKLDSNGNYSGENLNTRWDTSKKIGIDGLTNSSRKLYAHMEVVTELGTVVLDINKLTGNISIITPNNYTANSNQISIICGGNATIISDNGSINLQTNNGDIDINSSSSVNINTNSSVNVNSKGSINLTSVDSLNITALLNSVVINGVAGLTLASPTGVSIETPSLIVNANNLGGTTDSLVLLSKLIAKFNIHQHLSASPGVLTSIPDILFDITDGTENI